jgi:allantoin racemase
VRLLFAAIHLLASKPEANAAELEHYATAGQELMPPGSTFTPLPIAFGPTYYHESPPGAAFCTPGLLRLILQRQDDFDAVLVGCFIDPGVRAARTVVRIPVVGPGEAAMSLVQTVSDRFGIVTLLPLHVPEIAWYVRSLGLAQKCAGINSIGLSPYVLENDVAATLDGAEAAAQRLVARGAEAIVLGCTNFGFYPFAGDLSARLSLPVLDPVRAGIVVAYAHHSMSLVASPATYPPVDEPHLLATYLEQLERTAPSSETIPD